MNSTINSSLDWISHGVTLAWRNLNVYIGTTKQIINSVNGAIKPRSLVAVMGISGCGKTTFMSALAYRYAAGMSVRGQVLVNGYTIDESMYKMSGFMYQDDLFFETLTINEHLNIITALKMNKRLASYDKQSMIYDIIQDLCLTQKLNTPIANLSGGEKKLLAFATELLTDPQLLFCDEPTTGLDSYSARKMITIMSKLSNNGKTIVCTIHQPPSDVFALFSHIILITNGRIAFLGTVHEALTFLKSLNYRYHHRNYNPADFIIQTLARCDSQMIYNKFQQSEYAYLNNLLIEYEFHPNRISSLQFISNNKHNSYWFYTLCWLIYRNVFDCLRNPLIQNLRLIQKIFTAVMVGLCCLGIDVLTQNGIQNVQGVLFILVSENTFIPMYSVMSLFPNKLPLLRREYKAGLYSLFVYYVSNCIAMFPGQVIESTIFTTILYLMSGLRPTSTALPLTILITILTLNISIACGYFFSMVFNSVPTALAYLVPFDVLLLITQGMFIHLSSLPKILSWIPYISWLKCSTETMTIIQWENVQNINCGTTVEDFNTFCLRDGMDVLTKYSFQITNYYQDLIIMVCLYFTFHFGTFLALYMRLKN